jgi:hypothetical protein
VTQFYQLDEEFFRSVAKGGKTMARNFGVPQPLNQSDRGSLWPFFLVAVLAVGMVDAAVHLHR